MFAVSLSRALLRDAASFPALLRVLSSYAIQVTFTDEVEYIVDEYIEKEWPHDGSLGYSPRYATPFTANLSNFDSLFSRGEVIFY